MNPSFPPSTKGTSPVLPHKLFGAQNKHAIDALMKEIGMYIVNPARTECEKIIAQTMLEIFEGLSTCEPPKELIRRLDEFFMTLKDYEEARIDQQKSFEDDLATQALELARTRQSKGIIPFSIPELDSKISELSRQRADAISIQIAAEDEWKAAEEAMNSFDPGIGEGKAKVAEREKELRDAYEARNSNYRAITKTVTDLKTKIDRLFSIKESVKVLSSATLE